MVSFTKKKQKNSLQLGRKIMNYQVTYILHVRYQSLLDRKSDLVRQ